MIYKIINMSKYRYFTSDIIFNDKSKVLTDLNKFKLLKAEMLMVGFKNFSTFLVSVIIYEMHWYETSWPKSQYCFINLFGKVIH